MIGSRKLGNSASGGRRSGSGGSEGECASGPSRSGLLTHWRGGRKTASETTKLPRLGQTGCELSFVQTKRFQKFVYDKLQLCFDLQFLGGRDRARFLDKLYILLPQCRVARCPRGVVFSLTVDARPLLRVSIRASPCERSESCLS